MLVLNEKVPDEIKVPSKKEIKREPTGNLIVSEDNFKKAISATRDNERLKNSMKRLLSTDFAKENERLEAQNTLIYSEWEKESGENRKLREENHALRSENRDLRREIGLLYQKIPKSFLRSVQTA